MNIRLISIKLSSLLVGFVLSVSACGPQVSSFSASNPELEPAAQEESPATPTPPLPTPVPYPTRPVYAPGEMVDYVAQTGDTLPLLALRFNTSVEEILAANTFIPRTATTMPPGMPMKIPVYYQPFWGNPYQILPDSLFTNGPAQVGFDTQAFVDSQPGWLKNYVEYAADANRSGANIVDYIAQKWSLSPRLLLALLEYQSGALSQPEPSEDEKLYAMGYRSGDRQRLFLQLAWAANALNGAYYSLRGGFLTSLEFADGRIERFDPWQNTASLALHIFFNRLYAKEDYDRAVNPEGFAQTYRALFGDPWTAAPHIPGSLEQPAFILPFQPGEVWALTGGPHTPWGSGQPRERLTSPTQRRLRLPGELGVGDRCRTRRCRSLGVWRGGAGPGRRRRRAHRLGGLLPARGCRWTCPGRHPAQGGRPDWAPIL
jgi:LysM repeat protein